ncbi:hypothetical protein PPTG_21704 [Phytophthora nicotianae INRA-310]|uniref:Uncharacterized protein n=1 Tax=Phytophthora nicotianae (strain INRA-310) TaxID=761204 RepID=W2R051_PHYN3|nr:hypothetical protein PPTG_21704 [Phytophthora nicotianae INRA-310]ETN17870.1 hypothetical protein PPTG_21704 [Phytophthora nicotianae INRA-310]
MGRQTNRDISIRGGRSIYQQKSVPAEIGKTKSFRAITQLQRKCVKAKLLTLYSTRLECQSPSFDSLTTYRFSRGRLP